MTQNLSLHCFKGQSQALTIILLADYLEINLTLRLIKPINIKEKQYKATFSKQFPLLEISQGGFIEKTGAILRYLSRTKNSNLYNESDDTCNLIDQNLDFFYFEIAPVLYTFLAVSRHFIELDKKELSNLKKDVSNSLRTLDKFVMGNLDKDLNLFDFVVFSSLNLFDKDINKIINNCKSLKKRWSQVEKDERFNKILNNVVKGTMN